MPLPLIVPIVMGTLGLFGIGKTVKAKVDVKKAKSINADAKDIIDRAKHRQAMHKNYSKRVLKSLANMKLDVLAVSMAKFIQSFEKLKNVELTESKGIEELNQIKKFVEEIKETKEMTEFASSYFTGSIAGLGFGALAAWGAYGATTALACAGTGTAISTLSGIAATNATLAWIGGGTLAAGGAGVAGGATVLGIMVAGPAIAIMGIVIGAKASKMLDDASSNLAIAKKTSKQVDLVCLKLDDMKKRAQNLRKLIKKVDLHFKESINNFDAVIKERGTNWNNYNVEQKKLVFNCVKLAQLIKVLLDIPILTESGDLSSEYKLNVEEAENTFLDFKH